MKIFYSNIHRKHNPPFEIFDGGQQVPYLENPERMENILSALSEKSWADITSPSEFDMEPILAVHDPDYVHFIASAWDEWRGEASRDGSSSEASALFPSTFALRRQGYRPRSILGRAGYYMMDLSAPVVDGTYSAARAAAHCALSAANAIVHGDQAALALSRPPGHHAGRDYCAGYCYFNNAAIAAHRLSARGRVALLDIDYHAGNGSQDIFYERPDVLSISIHADPAWEYPYFAGYADQRGAGAGLGFHHNFPLPLGSDDTAYLTALETALEEICRFSPSFLVISAGLDIYEADPLGKFKITRAGIRGIARKIAALALPTVIVMEGGYNNEALGENLAAFLEAWAA